MKRLTILFFMMIPICSYALSEGVYTVIVKKQQEKQKNRWTLADWLSTKKTMALQDQWLALHSSETWFEFIFDYGTAGAKDKVLQASSDVDYSQFGAALYIKFLGLEYNTKSFDQLYDQSDYRLNLTILGSSVQSTHLRAFYGKRDYSYEGYSSYNQSFWGAHLSLYLTSYFGLESQFTMYSNESSDNSTYQASGERRSFGVFIDLWMLRIYAQKFRERMLYHSNTDFRKASLDGSVIGAKLFF